MQLQASVYKQLVNDSLGVGAAISGSRTGEIEIAPTVIRHWKRRFESGTATAVRVDEDVVPASALREAQAKIRELERALGRKTMENEILHSAAEVLRRSPSLRKGSGR